MRLKSFKMKQILILLMVSVLVGACRDVQLSEFHAVETTSANISSLRNTSTPIPCWDSIILDVHNTSIDLSKYGFFHNLLLDEGIGRNFPDSLCPLVDSVVNIINSSINNFQHSDISLYYIEKEISCMDSIVSFYWHDYLFGDTILVDSLSMYILSILNQVYDYGMLNMQELQLLINFVNSISTGNSIDYCLIKQQWSNISNKIEGGAFSGAALSIGVYSHQYWQERFVEGSDSIQAAVVLADFGGLVWGYSTYMYRNWENHYDPEFGLNALKDGAWSAVGSSLGGCAKYIRKLKW
jgi:hypothetical protein